MAEFVIMNNVLVRYNGTAEEVVIPDGVEKIGEYAFWFCKKLKILTIPASVKEICDSDGNVFGFCESLEQVNLSDGLEKIGANAFYCCSLLKSITIPASVKHVGNHAFDLKSVTLEGAAPKMGKDALGEVEVIYAPHASAAEFSQYKEAYLIGFLQMLKEGVSIDEGIVEKNKKNIRLNARKLCDTKNEELFVYMLRNQLISLKDVDELIARYNEEKNVARVAALIDYKEKNFTDEQKEEQFNKQFEIKEPTVTELRRDWAIVKKEDGTYRLSGYKGKEVDVVFPSMIQGIKITEIGNGKRPPNDGNLFFGEFAQKVKSITLPNGIKTIADYAFQDCTSLKRVALPEGLKTIGKSAFARCKSLDRVVLCGGLKKIGRGAFESCTSLKSIMIPASVKKIDGDYLEGTFQRCESLESVVLSEGLEKIAREAFSGCKSLTSITIPASVKEIDYKAFEDCTSLEEVILPDGQIKISPSAFAGCTGLKGENGFQFVGTVLTAYTGNASKVVVPEKTTVIGARAFAGKDISQIVFPEGLEKIGEGAFYTCKALKMLTIPASVKEIGAEAFSECELLEHVIISEGLMRIGHKAFYDCNSLKTITIPASVEMLDIWLFRGCPNVTIFCRGEERKIDWSQSWDEIDFEGNKAKVVWGYKGE